MPSDAGTSGSLRAELEQVRVTLAAAEIARSDAQQEVERLRREDRNRNEAAREWADDNDLCAQFERFCEAYGWEGRSSDVRVRVRVTADVYVQLHAVPRDDLDAYALGERIAAGDVRAALSELDRDDLEYSVEDWEED
ncbi:hypothetical protein [Gordonia sputi]